MFGAMVGGGTRECYEHIAWQIEILNSQCRFDWNAYGTYPTNVEEKEGKNKHLQ